MQPEQVTKKEIEYCAIMIFQQMGHGPSIEAAEQAFRSAPEAQRNEVLATAERGIRARQEGLSGSQAD